VKVSTFLNTFKSSLPQLKLIYQISNKPSLVNDIMAALPPLLCGRKRIHVLIFVI